MTPDINLARRRFVRTAALTAFAALPVGLFRSSASSLPVEGAFASLEGATGWLNSPALDNRSLEGRVVLVSFWTYSCINWRRTLPYLRAWHERYEQHGLTLIGVHSPEFGFEQDRDNVRRALQSMRIVYPVALDNTFRIWRAFNNQYWPALHFIDARGRIRHHAFGEGDYGSSEQVIQELLRDNGAAGLPTSLDTADLAGPELPADWQDMQSAENYVGYERTVGFESPAGTKLNKPHSYDAPAHLKLNHWGLSGDWTLLRQSIVCGTPGARIAYQFHARDLHLVMEPGVDGPGTRFQVSIDGKAPGTSHGVDVNAEGFGTIDGPRMYQLIRQVRPIGDRRFDITFFAPGVRAYSFTFG